jgi:hypothetical protein
MSDVESRFRCKWDSWPVGSSYSWLAANMGLVDLRGDLRSDGQTRLITWATAHTQDTLYALLHSAYGVGIQDAR